MKYEKPKVVVLGAAATAITSPTIKGCFIIAEVQDLHCGQYFSPTTYAADE
jgi:hypothetical protein